MPLLFPAKHIYPTSPLLQLYKDIFFRLKIIPELIKHTPARTASPPIMNHASLSLMINFCASNKVSKVTYLRASKSPFILASICIKIHKTGIPAPHKEAFLYSLHKQDARKQIEASAI